MCRWSPLPRRFGRLEDAVGEVNVKLAALIAHLDKTGEVEPSSRAASRTLPGHGALWADPRPAAAAHESPAARGRERHRSCNGNRWCLRRSWGGGGSVNGVPSRGAQGVSWGQSNL